MLDIFKQSIDLKVLKQAKTIVLMISDGMPYHEGDIVVEYTKKLYGTTEQLVIFLTGALQAYNIIADILAHKSALKKYDAQNNPIRVALKNEIDNNYKDGISLHNILNNEKIIDLARKAGQEREQAWIERNITKTDLSKLNIPRKTWIDDCISHKSFARCRKKVDELYEENPDFRKAVKETINKYVGAYIKGALKNFIPSLAIDTVELVDQLKEIFCAASHYYVMEECAALLLWNDYQSEYNFTFLVYPKELNAAIDFLLNNIVHKNNPHFLQPLIINLDKLESTKNSTINAKNYRHSEINNPKKQLLSAEQILAEIDDLNGTLENLTQIDEMMKKLQGISKQIKRLKQHIDLLKRQNAIIM